MTYANYRPFAGTGTIESLEFADLDGRFVSGIEDDPSGGLRALYYDDKGDAQYLPYAEAVASEQDIEVGALRLPARLRHLHGHAPAHPARLGHRLG